jgi:hypothetical protein
MIYGPMAAGHIVAKRGLAPFRTRTLGLVKSGGIFARPARTSIGGIVGGLSSSGIGLGRLSMPWEKNRSSGADKFGRSIGPKKVGATVTGRHGSADLSAPKLHTHTHTQCFMGLIKE